ncbi:MAG TPA: hypothetical protein VK927_07260 [Adhaeribacter sp.]|nr:hypothetical protein [Adhaeribacter sp.]
MKKQFFTLCLIFSACLYGCSDRQEAEIDRDYNEFRTWANQQGDRVETSTEAEWAEIERDYNERVTALDQRQDQMSAESRREYDETKANFQTWTTRNREYVARQQQTEGTGITAASGQWMQTLLGKYSDLNSITAANAREVYIAFMENVRANHGKWSDADWDEADKVFDQLDNRVDALENVSTKDKTKIGALKMEYRALETGDEAKGTYKSVKD